MKKIGIVIIAIVLIAGISGTFYMVNSNSQKKVQKEKTLTDIQKITSKDLDKNYPQTPREVVKLYNKILSCYYKENYTDKELDGLVEQALKLFDDELAANNYSDQGITMAQTDVCDSNDVKYITDNGKKIAYVRASYFMKEGSSYSKTYQDYVLRQDEKGCWKILTFYKVEADTDAETE